MASGLASNSFLFVASPVPHAKPSPKTHLQNRFIVYAKAGNGSPFSAFRSRKDDPSSSSGESQNGNNSTPFSFNFGKLSDVKSLIPVVTSPSGFGLNTRQKDPGTVFVAGANGLVGIRIVQALLRKGFKVRAGVSELGSAQELALFAAKYKIISNEESKRLNAVESSFDDPESIAKSIGNASKVVVTIGPEENGPAAEVSTSDAIQVVEAAQLAGVSHVAIVYDESALLSSTYNVLYGISSFFNNLFAKSQLLTVAEFLQRVIQTDVRYTFIKTKLAEDFSPESSYNVVARVEGSASPTDYKVPKSKMASLIADIFSDTAVAENKVVEIFTDPSAPARPINELLSVIPEDRRRSVYAEAQATAKAEEEALLASEKAKKAAEAAKKLEKEAKKEQESKASSLSNEAQDKAEAVGAASVESFLSKAKDFSSGLSWEKLGSQLATAVQSPAGVDGTPKVQVATVRGQAKARNLPVQKAVVKSPFASKTPAPKKPKTQQPKASGDKGKEQGSEKEVRNILGGLFKQETVYIDDD